MSRDKQDETRERMRYLRAIEEAERAAGAATRLEAMGLEDAARRALADAGAAVKAAAMSGGKDAASQKGAE